MMDAALSTFNEEETLAKREQKAKIKEEKINTELPLVINYNRLFFEDKRQIILDFARIKLGKFKPGEVKYSDSARYKLFKAIVNFCD